MAESRVRKDLSVAILHGLDAKFPSPSNWGGTVSKGPPWKVLCQKMSPALIFRSEIHQNWHGTPLYKPFNDIVYFLRVPNFYKDILKYLEIKWYKILDLLQNTMRLKSRPGQKWSKIGQELQTAEAGWWVQRGSLCYSIFGHSSTFP